MTNKEKNACHAIIHTHAAGASAVAAGLAQLPGLDNGPLFAIEVAMTIELGAVFGITLSKNAATAALSGVVGTAVGRTISQALVGWIPGLGNAINGATASSVVEAIGWGVAKKFEAQRDAGA